MSGGGLVRGGIGEIQLSELLIQYPHLAAAMRRDTEPIARAYEREHPGVVVVCDWEIIDDDDIASMGDAARQRALLDRMALAARRAAAKEYVPPPEPLRAGDPARTAEVLRRARIDMRNLDVLHPEYERLFPDFAAQINGLEAALGEPITKFEIGKTVKQKKERYMSDERKAELSGKVEAYKALTLAKRRESIDAAEDPDLTRLLLDAEVDPKLRDAIVLKLFKMEQTVAA